MKKKILIIMGIVVVLLLSIQGVKALYTSKTILDYYFNSKGFYFETDYDKTENVLNYWDGNSIEYNVLNSKEDKFTEDNISFEVTCSAPNGVVCKINDSTRKYTSTLTGGRKSSETIEVDVETTQKDVQIELITKSTAPYSKTIRNSLILHKDEDVVGSFDYEFVNYNNYSLLNISNYYNQDKCFNVQWDNEDLKVSVPDVTVTATDSNGFVNEFTKNVLQNETVSIKFYNEGNTTYDKTEFTITKCSLES